MVWALATPSDPIIMMGNEYRYAGLRPSERHVREVKREGRAERGVQNVA